MKFKKLFIFLGIFLIIFSSVTIYADNLMENIEVIFNSINIVVNGQKIIADNIIYKDTTYVSLRTVAEMLEKEVNWDQQTNTATIVEPINDKLKIVYASPKGFSEDAFLHWGYLNLVFDEEMIRLENIEDIYLVDCFGERIPIEKVIPGMDAKTNLLIIPKKQLKLNTNYNLYIPASTLESKDGEQYKQDVNLHFKTAYNVLQGQIVSNEDYMNKTIYIDNESNYYKTKVIGNGVFLIKNINPGKYNISMLDEKGDVLFKKEVEVNEKGLTHTKIYLSSNNNSDDISK